MPKITFFSKNKLKCPVCGTEFQKENLLTGRGRLNAGELTEELRRLYIPTEKYGKVNPLIYPVTVCPECFYAAYSSDFNNLPEKHISTFDDDTEERIQFVNDLIGYQPDFKQPRGLKEGLASYILTLYSYNFFPDKVAPRSKKGLSSLRAAWLCNDLFEEEKDEKWNILKDLLYKKSYLFYKEAFEAMEKGIETIDTMVFGPDLDKDYGYHGFLYIYCYLLYKYGLDTIEDKEEKKKMLEKAKLILSKVFGIGKSDKTKTVFLLERSRELYDKFSEKLQELE